MEIPNRHDGDPINMLWPSRAQLSGTTLTGQQSNTVDLNEAGRGFVLNVSVIIKYNDLDDVTHTFAFPAGTHIVGVKRIFVEVTGDLESTCILLF